MEHFGDVGREIGQEAREKVRGYLAAAFGLVAALAWNDAIKSLIEHIFPNKDSSVLLKFAYALIFTIIVILLTRFLLRGSSVKH